MIYIYKPDLEDRLYRIRDYITAKEAAIVLGLTKLQFSILKDQNLFDVAIPPVKGTSAVWRFSRDEISTYRDRFLAGLMSTDEDTWTFSQLLQFHSGSIKDPLITLLNAIEKKELSPVGRNNSKTGFASLVFSRVEFLAWIKRYKDKSSIDKMTVPSAAKLLQINQELTYQLVNHGYLKYLQSSDNQTRWITKKNLEDFENKYVFLSVISKRIGINSRTLISYLISRCVYPVDYEKDFQLRQKLYERKDLENILIFYGFL
ncbi:MAG: hypothetical protein IPK77_11865 [Cellvibrio sp.]|nr:hypothetical protein [Cellvibrio sp.]